MKKKIKNFFNSNPNGSFKLKDIFFKLQLTNEEEYETLKRILFELKDEEFLVKIGKRYELNKKYSERIVGLFRLSRTGNFGFVIPQNAEIEDIFIPAKGFNTALNGDLVEVQLTPFRKGKNSEGNISNVLKRNTRQVIGKVQKIKSSIFVLPENSSIHVDFFIPEEKSLNAKNNEKVLVSNIIWENDKLNPEAEIIEILSGQTDYNYQISLIANEFKFRTRFSESLLKETEEIKEIIPDEEISKRLDLRKKNIFTIDPEDAKDFDDAVSIEKLPNENYEVGIHIADVSHFVKKNSQIYKEAQSRGTSVYMVGSVIPMLPEHLSNNICSLVPNKDRLTFSVIAEMDLSGKVFRYQIKKSIINSKRRFTYDEVQNIIDTNEGDFVDEVLLLNQISESLKEKRIKKGSINFITPEIKFMLSDLKEVLEIKIKQTKQSHSLIEELMLLANKIVATHLNKGENKNKHPFVYRIHDIPDEEKIREFQRFVSSLGYKFDANSKNKSKELQNLLEQVKEKPEESVINEVAIRSMAKAVYSTENIGHYGLGFKYYTHFTSPIRRFPDLIVHKLIYNYLEKDKKEKYNLNELIEICEHSSEQERNATNAERLSVKLKQIEFIKNKIGEVYEGIISGVTHFGIFIELEENLTEGLIRFKDMDDDYYLYDEKNYMIIGKDTQKKYRLGDKVNVRIVRVDEVKREVEMMLVN